ncbi:MAG: hypothetical protein P1V81_14535 [Planctomycetota bacterium]|nr:hypothetical protein [Planctomycetota bacterium]
MLLNLLLIAALWLGLGFLAGLCIWLGLVLRRATQMRRRPVVTSAQAEAEPGQRSFEGARRESGTIHHALSDEGGGVQWAVQAPAQRQASARSLLSFPK